MGDYYSEILVRRKDRGQDMAIKVLIIAAIVICCAGGLFISPYVLIGAVVAVVAAFFLFPRMHVEYEYLYMNGTFDIDAIYSMKSRKKKTSFSVDGAECVAPLGSHELDSYQTGYTVSDYSAMDPSQKPYVVVLAADGERRKIILQLDDEKIFADIKRRLPRKVFEY